jgi:hypothetical protein
MGVIADCELRIADWQINSIGNSQLEVGNP